MEEIHSMIDEEDLYDEEGFGLEDEPHCTLLYGFHDDEVKGEEILKDLSTSNMPDKLDLVNASLFENDYDVLKFDVQAPNKELHEINKMLTDSYPYSTDYPDYHPPCTIAYIKKGKGQKYVDKFKDMDITVTPKTLVHSDA
jgi:2'-5' RNA ligase